MRILIVDDDPHLCRLLEKVLKERGIISAIEHDAASALATATNELFDVILLDLILPDRSGIEVARELQQRNITSKIIILTVQTDILDTVNCLNTCADDYITKPFNIEVLMSRINALMRRSNNIYRSADTITLWNEYELNTQNHTLTNIDTHKEISLTSREYEILRHLSEHKGALVTKSELKSRLDENLVDIHSRSVDTHITSLRKKLLHSESFPKIITIRGKGYMVKP